MGQPSPVRAAFWCLIEPEMAAWTHLRRHGLDAALAARMAAHALVWAGLMGLGGWRGLAAGVLENTVAALGLPPGELFAWLGPAIGPARFEVGAEVRQAFLEATAGDAAAAHFSPSPAGRWLCDLAGLARTRLARLGVGAVHGGGHCTASDPSRYFSHRRDAPTTGRMAALVWLDG